jgi:hypothetical protein
MRGKRKSVSRLKAPKKFRIGALEIHLKRDASPYVGTNGNPLTGWFELKGRNLAHIWVHPQDKEADRTFWHEFFHACVEDSGVKQMKGWTLDMEELVCEKFSRYVADILKK